MKLPNASKHVELGRVTPEDVENKLGIKWGKDIPIPDDESITVIFTNNAAAEKVPLTAWTIAHRIGHSFSATFRRNGRQDITYYEKEIDSALSGLLRYGYGIEVKQINLLYSNEYYMRNLKESIGTFRSARMKKLNRPGEFLYECFAQYLLSKDEITFNPCPEVLTSSNRKAWGRDVSGKYRLRDADDAVEYLEQLKNALSQYCYFLLESHRGAICIM